jgi:hypothetical protein
MPFGQFPMGGSDTPPYLVLPTTPTAPVRGGGRSGRVIAGIAAAALLLLGGAAAVGADAWAKGSVCDAVEQLGKGGGGSAGGPTSSDLDEAEVALKARARLLFFHGELRDATHGLADDIAAIRQMQKTVGADDPGESELTQMVLIAASVDSHARKAQRACGLPEQSLLDD